MQTRNLIPLAFVFLSAGADAKPSRLEAKNCRSPIARAHLKDAVISNTEILRKAIEPGARPADWTPEMTTRLSAVASVLGLCSTEPMIDRLGLLGQKVPMTLDTAPALALEAMLGAPIITGRYAIRVKKGDAQ